jgi:YVTN family beta-propeller protein
MKTKHLSILIVVLILVGCSGGRTKNPRNQAVGPQPDGSILVPSNQLLRPAGFQVDLPGRPVDLLVMPGGKYLLVKNMSDIDLIRIEDRKVMQSLPYSNNGASFTGICLSPDGSEVYVTDSRNRLCIADIDKNYIMNWKDPIILPQPEFGGQPAPGGIAIDENGDKIYVTLSRNNTLAMVTLKDRKITEIPVGMAPYGVILKSSGKAYVTNWGGRHPQEGDPTYNSSGSQVIVDPVTGAASNGSVSVVDLENNKEIRSIEVGLHPSGMALSPDSRLLYVACANSDVISVIDTENDEVAETISVHGSENMLFGSSPNALTTSPDGKYLYVANGTENAICVIRTGSPGAIAGYIPVGWYPGAVATDRDGRVLYVANVKGTGSRNQITTSGGYNSHDHLGSLSIIAVPSEKELKTMTEIVSQNNTWASTMKGYYSKGGKMKNVPVPVTPDQVSVFKHVVYIIKENRTYDQVFGDMPQGNGDTTLVHFGKDVTPNHHLLAETFILLDNFYCSGVLSADGHQWTDEAFVTDYLEKSFGGFTRSYPYDGDDALAYSATGFIWDNVLKHGLTFRDYGEFVNAIINPRRSTFSEIYQDFIDNTGKISIEAKANIRTIEPYICKSYIGFPNVVPDVYRADEFIRELKEFEKNDNFPNFIIMLLPNDHTSGTRPGMPTPRAAVADNDLALGRIVESISESKFWNKTCIFVTEDDPQAGLDHVDGHRTVGMVISPYTKRNEVVSVYYSQINMVRTIEDILGIPPMNNLDLMAESMVDCFTTKPDYTPYKAVNNKIPLDEINPGLASLSGDQLYWARKSMEQDLNDVDRIDEDIFNRIIWHSVKGYDKPYPVIKNNM